MWNKSKETTWTCTNCLDTNIPQSVSNLPPNKGHRRSIGPGAVTSAEVSTPGTLTQVTLNDIMDKLLQIESKYTDLMEKYETQIKINAELRLEIADVRRRFSVDSGAGPVSLSGDVFAELHDRDRRRNNFIIFGQPDTNTEPNANNDKATAMDIITNTIHNNQIEPNAIRVFRLGKFMMGKSRPIKVVCGSPGIASKVLSNAKCLKNKANLSHLSLSSDKTPMQLKEYREVKQCLDDRIAAGETNLRIKYINGSPRVITVDGNRLNSQVRQPDRPN